MSSTETLEIKNYIGLTGDKPIKFIASDFEVTLVNEITVLALFYVHKRRLCDGQGRKPQSIPR